MKFLLTLALLLSFPAHAQILSSYELKAPDAATLRDVSRLFEISGREGDAFEVMVPADQAGLFRLMAPLARLREADTSAALRARLESYERQLTVTSEARYHNLAEVQAWMAELEAKHSFAKVVSYGKSQGGRDLRALRLATAEGKPALMLTAATHGDEVITTEVMMALVDQLVENYGKDPRFTHMIDEHELYFIPVVNVDGFSARNRYETGRDPNRSYPYPEFPNAQPTASIAGLLTFFHARNIVGSVDFHAYGEMVMYPWAYTYDSIAPEDVRRLGEITSRMAAENRYDHGPISKVIYVAPGSSADYYYWKKKTMAVAVEMGRSKAPNPAQFPAYVRDQEEATWRFIESF